MMKQFGRSLLSLYASIALTGLYAESIDEDMAGFDDEPVGSVQTDHTSGDQTLGSDMDGFDDDPVPDQASTEAVETDLEEGFEDESESTVENSSQPLIPGLTGELTQKLSYSWNNDAPHDGVNSFKSELFLDYEHKFENGYKFKVNAKAYYDAIYSLKERGDFREQELNELESEIELFDTYLEGKITDDLDFKIGRQVVVWGRSDTIRVTDILNPLDNRVPGMVDIEDLRLPVTMAKFDYFIGNWRLTPIAILEQRFSKNPPFGGDFYPAPVMSPEDKSYDDVTYALSIGGEFEGWDINLYAAHIRDDGGYIDFSDTTPRFKHDKVKMAGAALNILSGSWLFKSEIAHLDGLKYTSVPDMEFRRTDLLLGFEYNGIADTMISYDIVSRHIHSYDNRLMDELNPLKENDYQHAFRINSEFFNATLTANYLISLFGNKLDEGGFQRAWVEYDLADGISLEAGVVDYIGGSPFYDKFKNNDRLFADITYSF